MFGMMLQQEAEILKTILKTHLSIDIDSKHKSIHHAFKIKHALFQEYGYLEAQI